MQTWTILSLSVMNTPDIDTVVTSSFQVSDSGQFVNYSVELLPPDAKNFTPYSAITEAQAIQWTQDALGAERVAGISQALDNLVAQAAIPSPQSIPLPWVE
jgi:hypothetical protein